MSAYGTAAAIGQMLGGKRTKALQQFISAVRPNFGDALTPVRAGPKTIEDYQAGIKNLMMPEAQ